MKAGNRLLTRWLVRCFGNIIKLRGRALCPSTFSSSMTMLLHGICRGRYSRTPWVGKGVGKQSFPLPLRHLSAARATLRQFWKFRRGVKAPESSRNFLDGSSGVHRIPPDWPGPANFQQRLNYGRIPRSARRISPCYHVHSPGGAPTKTRFDCTFHRTNPAELRHSPRKPRLGSEPKALIQKGRLEAGDLPRS